MKALVISMLVLLIAFFSFIPAFAQPPEDKPAQAGEQKEEPEHKKAADVNSTADVNAIADANAAVEPNAVGARVEEFEGLDKALEQINKEGKDEIREWRRRTEDKLDLALAVQKQITAEFNFLRELAVEEGAVKTTAAIDRMLLDRQERFKDVIERFEKEKERLRLRNEREERRSRDRDRSRERTDRSRRNTSH